jgi:chitinase
MTACAAGHTPFAVVGYYDGDAAGIAPHHVGALTHLIFAFGHLDGDTLRLSPEAETVTLPALVALKGRVPGLKVLLSLGGWGGCEHCSEVFARDTARRAFARSVRDLTRRLGTDGIDLDWEYPVVPGVPGHRYGPEDRASFTALVRELRAALGKQPEITFAAGGFTAYLEQSIDWKRVMPYVDRVHLMTYDLVHGYSTATGHHTPLYSTPWQVESVDHAVRLLDSLGVPRRKIAVGAAFYARVFDGVDSIMQGRYRPGRFRRGIAWRDVADEVNAGRGFAEYWDSTAAAPWAYNAGTGEYVTLDDTVSVRLKTEYAARLGLAGIAFWQLGDDRPDASLLQAIARARPPRR